MYIKTLKRNQANATKLYVSSLLLKITDTLGSINNDNDDDDPNDDARNNDDGDDN